MNSVWSSAESQGSYTKAFGVSTRAVTFAMDASLCEPWMHCEKLEGMIGR